jgi:hypothetical protein
MAAQILPTPIFRGEDNNGKALAGGLLYTYAAGTTTPQATYTDSTGLTPNTNPVVLNSRGEAPVWLTLGQSYKLLLRDSHGDIVPGWPVDQIQGAGNFSFLLQSTLTNTTLPTQGAGFIGDNTALAYPPGSVGYEINLRLPVFPSIAILKTRVKTFQPSQVFVSGYYTPGDGGGGLYRYDATDTTSVDNGGTIIVAADGGRWKLAILSGYVSLEQFGAKGDGTSDDTAAVTKAIATGLNVSGRFSRTYRYTSGVMLTTQGQTIDLQGATLKPTGSGVGLGFSAAIITLRNFTMDCSGLTGFGLSAASATQRLVVEDVTLLNGANGLLLTDCFTSWFVRFQTNFFSGQPVVVKSTIPGTATNSIWFLECSFNNNTTVGDVVHLEGGVGIWLDACNFQANGATSNEIRVVSNSGIVSVHVSIENCYFEDFGATGNCIYLGDPASGTNLVASTRIRNNYFQSSKRPVVIGAFVANDVEISGNTFQYVVGTGFAVVTPANYVPNCHSNAGSLPDIDRSFTPNIQFGGSQTGVTYGTANGRWTRVNGYVTCTVTIVLTNKGSATGQASIGGFPITSSVNLLTGPGVFPFAANVTGVGGGIIGAILPNQTSALLYTYTATGNAALADTNFANNSSINGTISFEV